MGRQDPDGVLSPGPWVHTWQVGERKKVKGKVEQALDHFDVDFRRSFNCFLVCPAVPCGSCLKWWAGLMLSSRDFFYSLLQAAPDYQWEVSPHTSTRSDIQQSCLTLMFARRFPEPEPSFDNRQKDVWIDRKPRWFPPLSHDVCELPEVAWLLQHRDHARETVDCSSRGPAIFPPLLISHISHSHI